MRAVCTRILTGAIIPVIIFILTQLVRINNTVRHIIFTVITDTFAVVFFCCVFLILGSCLTFLYRFFRYDEPNLELGTYTNLFLVDPYDKVYRIIEVKESVIVFEPNPDAAESKIETIKSLQGYQVIDSSNKRYAKDLLKWAEHNLES